MKTPERAHTGFEQVCHNQALDGREQRTGTREKRASPSAMKDTPAEDSKFMWDAKRQVIWLTTA
ncbi:MAG TPA: hypothetical protein VM095_17620, partial [Pyrinomonadaceae bacterium]|nr:hypothetical protein [Pyrinomonadaceae bacterium]